MKELERLPRLILSSATIVALYHLLFFQFSKESRREILRRDNHQCRDCGARDRPLEAAHYEHKHSLPHYDSPSNGRALCTYDHYLDHFHQRDKTITFYAHLDACRKIWERLDNEDKIRLPSPDMMLHTSSKEKAGVPAKKSVFQTQN